eukprot:scaffold127714_cov16-Tisochrysis_lutea.AAC.2
MILSCNNHHLKSLALGSQAEALLSCTLRQTKVCVAPCNRCVVRRPTLLRSKNSGSVEEEDEAEEEGKPALNATYGFVPWSVGRKQDCSLKWTPMILQIIIII